MVIEGLLRYDEKVDIWSAGCVFYELLCGKILFESEGGGNNVAQVRELFSPLNCRVQLDKIIEVLGTPAEDDLAKASPGARNHIRRSHHQRASRLMDCFNDRTLRRALQDEQSIELLQRGLLAFNPVSRPSSSPIIIPSGEEMQCRGGPPSLLFLRY